MRKVLPAAFCVLGLGFIIWALVDTLYNQGIMYLTALVALCVISIAMAFAILLPVGTKTFFENHKKGALLTVTAAGFVLVTASCLEPYLYVDKGQALMPLFRIIEERLEGTDLFGYYAAQLSLTFISISVMSVLSDKSVIIYWANVSEDRLIKPTFSCFAAYTYYSIGATVGAGLGIALDNTPMFVVFFAINVAILILLTFSMIDVYYGRDTKKRKLQREMPCVPLEKDDPEEVAEYEACMMNLIQNTLRAKEEKNISFLLEVYELMLKKPGRFRSELGRETISTILSTVDDLTVGPFVRLLKKFYRDAFDQSLARAELALAGKMDMEYSHLQDNFIWEGIAKNRYITDLAAGKAESNLNNGNALSQAVGLRLALFYNESAVRYLEIQGQKDNNLSPEDYLVVCKAVYLFDAALKNGQPLTEEKVAEVMDGVRKDHFYDFNLAQAIITYITHVFGDSVSWIAALPFVKLPLVGYWLKTEEVFHEPEAKAVLEALYNHLNKKN